MPSIFERAAMKASTAIDAVHGTQLRFIPKPRVDNFGQPIGAADGRVAIDLVGGLVRGAAAFEFLAGDKRNSEFAAQSVNATVYATVDRRQFPDPNNQPRKEDLIATRAVPIETFLIAAVDQDGPARYALLLVRAP